MRPGPLLLSLALCAPAFAAQPPDSRGASFQGWLPDGGMLVATRIADTHQLQRVVSPLGMQEQVTLQGDPVAGAVVSPGEDPFSGFVYGRGVDGDEFPQLYLHDLGTQQSTLLTDGKRSRNKRPVWSRDGGQLAWSSTARNGTDYDVWVRTPNGKSRAVVAGGGEWLPLDFSTDAEHLLVMKVVSINEAYPGEVDLATGKLELFPVGGGKAAFTDFRYGNGDGWVYYVSNEESRFRSMRRHKPETGQLEIISKHVPWDVSAFDLSPSGQHLAYVANEGGIDKLRVVDLRDMAELALPEIPAGVIANPRFAPNGVDLAMTLDSATAPSDVYVVSVVNSKLGRWTQTEVGAQ